MMTLLNNLGQMEKEEKSDRKHICSKLLVLGCHAAMILACFGLFPGCGSDGTSESPKAKEGQTRSLEKKSPSVFRPLMTDQARSTSEKGEVREIMPGVNQEQLEARLKAEREKVDAQKNREFLPGMRLNQKEMEDKIAEERKKLNARKVEVMPGMPGVTQKELSTMIGQEQKKSNSEVLPGATQVELDTRVKAEQRKHNTQMKEVMPGGTRK